MKICIQLIENYLKQEIPTIILTIEKQKYIFNMPTCFQRFIKDHKQKFPKGSAIFFTKTSTETLAGLNGFMLSIFESKFCQDSKLYVSDQMYKYLEEVRYKMGFKILPYSYSNLFSKETRTGIKNIEQVYELVDREDYAKIFMDSENYIKSLPKQQKNQSVVLLNQHNEFYDGDVKIIPFDIKSNGQKIINYLCIFNKLEGKVLANKAKQLQIPPKLISKLLAQGQLTLEDGRIILAQQIKQADSPSPNVIILHYNSIESVFEIQKHPKLIAYLSNPENLTESIIHIVQNTVQPIVESKQFKQFISHLPPSTKHIVYNRNYVNKDYNICKQPVPQHMELVSFVNKYYPNCMPDILQQHFDNVNINFGKNVKVLEDILIGANVHCYKRCYQLVIAPKKNQGYALLGEMKEKQKKQYVVPQNIKIPQNLASQIPLKYGGSEIDPRVIFLGTGSMKPSKYRNVSSIYLQMVPHHGILLDCGEGTYYQLYNHFGYQQIDQIVLETKVIFITHIHSDHNLGILDLIAQRNKLLRSKYSKQGQSEEEYSKIIQKQKLFLIIPYNVLPWFNSFVANIQNLLEGCDVLFVQTLLKEELQLSNATISKDETKTKNISRRLSEMMDEKEEQILEDDCLSNMDAQLEAYFSPIMKSLIEKYEPTQSQILTNFNNYLQSLGISQFLPAHVDHCPQSFGVIVTHKSGMKVSYSGDCRPSQQFIKAAHGSTLLIHEATFGDDLLNNAIQNKHTTVGEAIDIAIASESWKLALTHFSQRYISAKQIVNPSLYKLNELKKDYALNHSIVCFDHLRMKMSQLPLLAFESRKICQIFPSDSQE